MFWNISKMNKNNYIISNNFPYIRNMSSWNKLMFQTFERLFKHASLVLVN